MKPDYHRYRPLPLWRLILLASLTGGMAEIVWVSLYAAFTSLTAATVAREVTASLLPAFAAGATGVWLGIVIHMLLAVALGYGFVYVLWNPFARPQGMVATLAAAVLTLAVVWSMNFFVVLPVLNLVFITLMPYPVTFASKMLFALAMAVTLVWPELRRRVHESARATPLAG
ncbi:MAG: hypothetical protein A3D32_04180 [Candidatus Muproteobacteria bacterium RIFCSPHIGHO2_02_FULL_60_13]|uniref:Uncharacterized protein n=1 Tax=Candidatus Muproteobacteria bacterium RIFCSPLOWO2_01_FULL_60_18 TaxID=1817768 RepID=A0A1F6TZM2_9PROT|nr:MAG: hypothetical protein A3A87_05675 [Candidatus Muproteobacteria bacterium RIFCSPLOWO2_01_FULL_60_18]OGI56789.1 MAG: hypothetical protein A3D32_04180 [Candidatus Muproteobacteria bacterium RIFCSPHIGHO2_02_FULL_60_13]